MFVSCSDGSPVRDWSQSTLVIPCVSVGNVGQLSCDVLITTLNAQRVGYLYDDSIIPAVGHDPFLSVNDSDVRPQLATALEVYEHAESNIVIVQQRAPLVKGKTSQFVSRLVHWIVSSQFKMVTVLTSVFAHVRRDSQLTGCQQRYIVSSASLLETMREQLGQRPHQGGLNTEDWIEMEQAPQQQDDKGYSEHHSTSDADTGGSSNSLYIPGSGIARRLFTQLKSKTSTLMLLTFCEDGDNSQDAINLVSYLNSFIHCISPSHSPQLKMPMSWRQMYGCRFDQNIFQ